MILNITRQEAKTLSLLLFIFGLSVIGAMCF